MSLHPGELARVRSAWTPQFTARATVMRKAQVRDSSGGFTDSYAVFDTYDCSFARYPLRPRDVPSTPRIQTFSAWYFTFPDGSDVRLTDRLVVGSRTFEVSESGARSTNITLLVVAEEIT